MTMKLETVQYIEGTVTNVNPTLCQFTLKTEGKSSLVYSALANIIFPNKGDKIVVFDLHKESSTTGGTQYFLNSESSLYSSEPIVVKTRTIDTKLHCLTQQLKWTVEELTSFAEKRVNFAPGICSVDELNVELVEYLCRTNRGIQDAVFSTPSSVHYVQFKHDYVKDSSMYLTHGIHHSDKGEVLIGSFKSGSNCCFELTDGWSIIYLEVKADCNFRLLPFLNRLVCVEKFAVVTELYQGGLNLEYVLCDIVDFHLLNIPASKENVLNYCIGQRVPDGVKFSDVFSVKILNLALPNSTARRTTECWMKALIVMNGNWCPVFLCFENELFTTLPLLDIGQFYEIYLQNNLISYFDPEITRIAKGSRCFKVRGGCVFVPDVYQRIPVAPELVMTLKQLDDFMRVQKGKGYVHFEAIVTARFFVKADEHSRTPRQINSHRFGTPGNKRHVVKFEDWTDDVEVCLYLNNWERKQCPLGIVPQMRVIVRDAEICNKYLKSTAMTTFQVICYESPTKFNTANLNPKNDRKFYGSLGNGHCVPYQALIRAKPTCIQLRTLNLIYESGELKLISTLTTSDERNCATVICKNVDLIKKLFFDSRVGFDRLLNVMKLIGKFSIYQEAPCALPAEHQRFYNDMSILLKAVLDNGIVSVDWVCKRIEENSKSEKAEPPLWLCTDIYDIKF